MPLLREIHEESRRTYGVKRMTITVNKMGLTFAVGQNRVRKLMKKLGIYCESIRKYRPHNNEQVYPFGENILDRNFEVNELNKVWVTDITYVYVPGSGFAYLATAIDLASKKPVGWYFSKTMTSEIAIKSVKNALINQGFPKGVLVHSDRGSQYTSRAFMEFLELMDLRQSFSKKGCPYDNAVIESFHASLKKELIYRFTFNSFEHAKLCIFDYIENFYIRKRLHSGLGYMTPQQMEDRLKLISQAAA